MLWQHRVCPCSPRREAPSADEASVSGRVVARVSSTLPLARASRNHIRPTAGSSVSGDRCSLQREECILSPCGPQPQHSHQTTDSQRGTVRRRWGETPTREQCRRVHDRRTFWLETNTSSERGLCGGHLFLAASPGSAGGTHARRQCRLSIRTSPLPRR